MGRNTLGKPWQWFLAVFSCLVVAFFSATVLEVVLAAGLVGIFIDSFAEKQLRRLGQLQGVTSRRKRIAARVTLERRRRRLRDTHFVGGYLTRAMAEERVRQAARPERPNSGNRRAAIPAAILAQTTRSMSPAATNRPSTNGTTIRENHRQRNFGQSFSLACQCRSSPK